MHAEKENEEKDHRTRRNEVCASELEEAVVEGLELLAEKNSSVTPGIEDLQEIDLEEGFEENREEKLDEEFNEDKDDARTSALELKESIKFIKQALDQTQQKKE